MSKLWIPAVGVVLIAVVATVAWQWSTPPVQKAPTTVQAEPVITDQTAQVTQPASVSRDFELRWREGTAQSYLINTDSMMQMGGVGPEQVLKVRFDGRLDVLTLQAEKNGAMVGMQLADVEVRINDRTDENNNRSLQKAFRVRFSDGGMPAAFEFPEGLSQQNRLTLENLVRMFQVTINKGERWTAQEHNGTGSYEAVYHHVNADSLQKQKRQFVSGQTQDILTGAVIESTESIRVDSSGDWLLSMTVDETLKKMSQDLPAIAITNHATIERDPTAKPLLSAADLQFDAVETEAVNLGPAKPAIPDISPEEAEERILAALPQLDAATEGRTTWIHQLRDLIQVDPAMPEVLLEALRNGNFSDRTRADLYLAFELAGTDSAQAALVSVVDDAGWSTRDALRAIVALGGVKQPSDQTLEALWNTAQSQPYDSDSADRASTATFALGSLGKTMNNNRDPDYAGLREELLSYALGSADVTQRSNYTLAIGNTQDAGLTRDVLGMLSDEAEDVRRSAAISLGRLDTDQAADSLMQQLAEEPSGEVRSAITESLSSWSEPTPQAMLEIGKALANEIDESARYNMARFLAENLEEFPQNREVLQQLLRTERSKRIRQHIANALAKKK